MNLQLLIYKTRQELEEFLEFEKYPWIFRNTCNLTNLLIYHRCKEAYINTEDLWIIEYSFHPSKLYHQLYDPENLLYIYSNHTVTYDKRNNSVYDITGDQYYPTEEKNKRIQIYSLEYLRRHSESEIIGQLFDEVDHLTKDVIYQELEIQKKENLHYQKQYQSLQQ